MRNTHETRNDCGGAVCDGMRRLAIGNVWLFVIKAGIIIAAAVALLFPGGCAAGRGPAGEVIVGWDVARLPETAGESLNAAAGFLPAPWNYLATGVLGALGIGGVGAAARSSGRHVGWDEREKSERDALALRALAAMHPQQAAGVLGVAVHGGGVGGGGGGHGVVQPAPTGSAA